MPSTDDGPVRFFPAYSFHFTKAGWSSMDGCTSFDHHGCQNVMTQVVAIDLSSMAGWTNLYLMQAGDIQLLHSQTEGAYSKASCRTWHDSIRYGLTHLLDPVLILFLLSDHHHIAALVAIVGVANWQIRKSFLNENLIFKQFAKVSSCERNPLHAIAQKMT